MAVQKKDWGQIEWFSYSNGTENPLGGMNVGIVTVNPGEYEPIHIHYDEQLIYVLEGEAICKIDDRVYHLKAGDLYFWPAGVSDEVLCIGEQPFRHLLSSNPLNLEESMLIYKEELPGEQLDQNDLINLLYIAVEAIRTQFLEGLHYAYAIFNCCGTLVHKSSYFPEHCLRCCSPSILYGSTLCMISDEGRRENHEKSIYLCKYGMQVFNQPIFYQGHYLGLIKGGFVRQSQPDDKHEYGVYDMPRSGVWAIYSLMGKIAKATQNFCEFNQFRKSLSEQELRINTQLENQRIMEENLQKAEYAMTDLKINNHFLFNTLNSMASMALTGGNKELYQSIINLSEMFRHSLMIRDKLVSLETEFGYLKSYLELQSIRYRSLLEVEYQVDEALLLLSVPNNFLQPIVENAFVHGFHEDNRKRLTIRIQRAADGRIEIMIANNGNTITPERSRALLAAMQSGTSHGMSIVYQKLKYVFEDDFDFRIIAGEPDGTRMYICFPIITTEGSET